MKRRVRFRYARNVDRRGHMGRWPRTILRFGRTVATNPTVRTFGEQGCQRPSGRAITRPPPSTLITTIAQHGPLPLSEKCSFGDRLAECPCRSTETVGSRFAVGSASGSLQRQHPRARGRETGRDLQHWGWNRKASLGWSKPSCAILDELSPRADGQSYRKQIAAGADRPGHDRLHRRDKVEARVGSGDRRNLASRRSQDRPLVPSTTLLGRET